MDLNQVLSKLKSTVTGVKSLKLDQELDKAISDINKYRTFNGDRTYLDLVRSLINKLGSVSDIDSIINTEISPASIGQQARLDRYKLYQDIAEKVSYCDRALKVLTDNILAPDDITKRSIEVSSSTPSRDDTEVESLVSEIKTLISKLKLDDNIDETVYSALLFGDYFIEISDSATSTKNNTIVVEQNLSKDDKKELETESVKIELDLSHFNFELKSVGDTIEILNEKNELLGESEKPLELDAEDIFLLFHSPKYVVRLQSERFDKVCLGYLVFPKYDYFLMNQTILSNTVDGIISKIAGVLDVALDTKVKIKKNRDVELIVRNVLQQIKDQNQLKVRFVPIDRMIHFRIGSIHKYFPYGQSIFDPVAFQAKLLIAQQVANVIFRLSRSTEKRIVGVEIGLPRDARELVETLKEQFRKRKINIDSFGTLDSIASNIATFEDIYLPMKDGKRFVEVEAGNFGGVDIRGRVDETKFLRDMIVAGLNVPPSFLGIEENLSNKCLDLNTKIPLLNGKSITLKGLVDEYESNGKLENKYVYSYDRTTGKIVPGKIVWAGITRRNAKVVRVTLDNGESIVSTPDHKFMLRDGTYVEAQYLKSGDKLMPLYRKYNHMTTTKRVPYEAVYHPGIESWEPTHRVVAKHENLIEDGDGLNVHHVDFNPLNNNPENLLALTNKEHLKVHIEHKHFITTGRGKVKKENYIECICEICGKTFIKHISANQKTCLSKSCIKEMRRRSGRLSFLKRQNKVSPLRAIVCPFCGRIFFRRQSYLDTLASGVATCGSKECYKESFRQYSKRDDVRSRLSKQGKVSGQKNFHLLVSYVKEHGAPMKGRTKETHPEIFRRRYETFKRNRLNHKVVKVELLDRRIDTGDITVERYHNFAVSSGVIISNSALSEENILFTRTVIGYQRQLIRPIRELLAKCYSLMHPTKDAFKEFEKVNISFPIPKSLQFERESKYVGDMVNLIESLKGLGIPKDYLVRRYLTNLDWEDIESWEIKEKIEKTVSPPSEEEAMGGMGGGGASGF